MEKYFAGKFDIAVIGAGHAGIEAALAAARLGMKTLCFCTNLDAVGNMPCNPAIGGTGKGHLVRELDALGGEMGKAADAACIQYRMLNLGKGPAVHSLRAQADRAKYHSVTKAALEKQENLFLKQAEITEVLAENGAVTAVVTHLGAVYQVSAAIICTGTYLGGEIVIGESRVKSGPDGTRGSYELFEYLKNLGITLRRFKTGTPPRINRRSVDFSKLEIQYGDENIEPFSFDTDPENLKNSAVCHLTYTNAETHKIIMDSLDRSPIYSGAITGVGPRYCPSIETKVVRFADKSRHPLFIEPMGEDTNELYLQGFSSSMPEEVQMRMIRTLPGLENAEVTRPAYAIEYDCTDPTELWPTLESKKIAGLYGAGQFNGSSGYEEAAVQGFMAGVNAARKLKGESPFILKRSEAYIGALIDDLVTKGTDEPYRMMTSRSEYRLILRQDNADGRLAKFGYELGLVSRERYEKVLEKYAAVERELGRLERQGVPPSEELNAMLASRNTAAVTDGARLADLLRRPQVDYECLAPFDPGRPALSRAVREQVEISLKYEGYIQRQIKQVEEFSRLEEKAIPQGVDYASIKGLRLEAREKLAEIRPMNLGQASRISGVSPADMAVLMLYLSEK
ncbi:MAG: tRNA uridine-5-carboxymethylaminomethyl(34) synthesis enzyme MnmG [Oscillospiraceae bacterium]|nr:tRNA uridine-5-carboxymethylaminomethyl(34) synthesis enzyme MnmG [Oscillospiraceae bacterium]